MGRTEVIARPHKDVCLHTCVRGSVCGCLSVSKWMGKPFPILSSAGGGRGYLGREVHTIKHDFTPECKL